MTQWQTGTEKNIFIGWVSITSFWYVKRKIYNRRHCNPFAVSNPYTTNDKQYTQVYTRAHFKNSVIVWWVWPNRNIADVLLRHSTTCTHTSLKIKEMTPKPVWTAQSHFPTLSFSFEPWKVPTVIQKLTMIKDSQDGAFHEEGTGLYYHNIHDLGC